MRAQHALKNILLLLLALLYITLLPDTSSAAPILPSSHLIPEPEPSLAAGIHPSPHFPYPFSDYGTSRPPTVHSPSSRYHRLIKISWIYVTSPETSPTQPETHYVDFWVDPLTTHVPDAVSAVCISSEFHQFCGGDAGLEIIQTYALHTLSDLFNPRTSLTRLFDRLSAYLETTLNGSLNRYLKSSDATSAEFVMYQNLEISSILVGTTCNSEPGFKHARPGCASPVDLHSKSIGACPFGALDELSGTPDSFKVYPSDHTCSNPTPNTRLSPQQYLVAGQRMTSSSHNNHGIALFYLTIEPYAVDPEKQSDKALFVALSNLASALGAVGEEELMALAFYAALAQPGADPSDNLSDVIKFITHVPPVNPVHTAIYRENWVEDVESLISTIKGGRNSWPFTAAKIRDPVSQIGQTLFHLSHQGSDDRQIMEVLSRLYDSAVVPPSPLPPPPPPPSPQKAKVRVAFVSTLLYDHSIGKMMVQVMRALDSSKFEIVVVGTNFPQYTASPSLPPPSSPDAVISHALKHVMASAPLPFDLSEAAKVLSSLNADIIIYPDIGMSPLTYFLSRLRISNIQTVWWGHPITTGLSTIDYYFGLDYELDHAGEQYEEQLIRFEYINTAPFASVPDGPEITDPLEYFGIQLQQLQQQQPQINCEKTHVYMVLGRLFKIHTSFERIMFKILEEDACGVIVLITEKQANWNNQVHNRIESHFQEYTETWPPNAESASNILGRIRYVSYWNYVRILAHADTILDTYPYGGCLTAQEGLSNGKVVITLPSTYVRGRFAGKILEQMGVPHIIATDEADYVRKAVKVASDGAFREALKNDIREGWENNIHRDEEVAEEWGEAFFQIFQSIYHK
ncbi:hypothetical protein TrVE_jg10041 [Triparma verrucosa]|uniref:O-GlcNAc transferase C-terminal domain-containing protein n=1 Tax=Triparma verrucosa TaxID=1606542 RepID=A0A9W6Z314_9STRA|nr:hypothetical protein TrVE_jg10041 [Triparma verrucosa]